MVLPEISYFPWLEFFFTWFEGLRMKDVTFVQYVHFDFGLYKLDFD